MNPIGDGLYECVYLKGHPALSTSNSDDPAPGSWHSKDVFMPHPTIPEVWKYVTRIDDRITLVNGEKVLPLPIEGRIREDELVREAVVVGVDRAIPGLLVFRAPAGDYLSDDSYLEAIWPAISDANSRAEGFSQITREMVTLMPSHVAYPQTDKRSIIRAQVYRQFAGEIEDMYTRLEGEHEGLLQLDLAGLEECLGTIFQDIVGAPVQSLETDFFTAGVDSLKAIQMRRIIQKTIALNGYTLPQNIVYNKGNIKRLAGYLHSLVNEREAAEDDEQANMTDMIERYSHFQEHKYLNGVTNGDGHGDNRSSVVRASADWKQRVYRLTWSDPHWRHRLHRCPSPPPAPDTRHHRHSLLFLSRQESHPARLALPRRPRPHHTAASNAHRPNHRPDSRSRPA